MALPPRSPVEGGHRGGRPWRPRLSDAVSMMPKNDWFHGSGQRSLTAHGETPPHLGEETVAGCEMLLNKVIPRVILRPVTRLPRHRGIYSLVLHMENLMPEFILCLRRESDLGFVCLCVRWW